MKDKKKNTGRKEPAEKIEKEVPVQEEPVFEGLEEALSTVPEEEVKKEDLDDTRETFAKKEETAAEVVIPLASDKEMKKAQKKAKKEEKKALKKEKKQKNKKKRIIIWSIVIVLLLALIGGGAWFVNKKYHEYMDDVPELDLTLLDDYSIASKIYDRNGELLTEVGANENVDWVGLEDCPQQLIDAFISIEDVRFYQHPGFDIKRLISAVIGQVTGKGTHGASTITQQLVRRTYLSSEVTYKRKAQEIYLSYQLEQKLDKDQILEYYINRIYFGDLAYGIGAAADDYFDKDVSELTLKECAMLAGVINSPSMYNPRWAEDEEMTLANERTNTVLYAMWQNEKITEEEYEAAVNEPLVIAPKKVLGLYDYPYFIEYAIDNVAAKMIQQDGGEVNDDTLAAKKEQIKNGGYEIYTTLDRTIQETLDTSVEEYTNYPVSKDGSETEVTAVIINQHNGEVVAMRGGRHLPEERESFNRATMSKQPTGSSFKPVSVYAPCLEVGYSPGTVVADKKEPIIGYGLDNGYPGGECFNRGVTMREALESSHNIPASRFLCELLGIDNSVKYLLLNGFQPEELSSTASGEALGADSVTTLEMTAAYATLANGGTYIEPHGFTKVVDRHGKTVLTAEDTLDVHTVYSLRTCWQIVDMMSSNMVSGLGVHARLSGMASAGKTGTHEDEIVDFGGFTPYYTSFIRMSTDNYTPFKNAWSYTQPTRLWKQYMTVIHEDLENKEILDVTPSELGLYKVTVCRECGKLPIEGDSTASEWFYDENRPTQTCQGHWESEWPEPEDKNSEEWYWWNIWYQEQKAARGG